MPRKQKGKGVYQKAVNVITRNKNPLKDGERHPILYTEKGFMPGSYMGPGTDLLRKIKNDVKPVSKSDKTAQAHDLRYTLAKSPDDVRAADKRMIEVLDRIQKEKGDYRFNIYQGKIGIKTKMALEDKLGLRPDYFTTFGNNYEPGDVKILEDKLNQLEMEGYGKKKKSAWLTHVAKYRAKHPDKSYKDCLIEAKKSYKK